MEEFLRTWGAIGVFLGAAFEGQTAVVVGGLLARQHLMPLWVTLLSATAGSAICDHILFVAGRRFRSTALVSRATAQPAFAMALRFLERYPVRYILAFRFIFGLRLASPVAIGASQVPTWRFAVLNVIAAAVWATAFTVLGYVFGGALEAVLGRHAHGLRSTLIIAGVLVAGVLAVGAVRRWRRRGR